MAKTKKTEAKSKTPRKPAKVVKRKLAKYKPLKALKTPHPKGLMALKAKKGKQLHKSCLFCNKSLKARAEKSGRNPFLCEKKDCFKKMRCAYRYDWEHDKLGKPIPKPAKAVIKTKKAA